MPASVGSCRANRRLCGVLAGVLTVGAIQTAPATQQNPPLFKSGVDIVRVDVSALDKERRPIRGLTAQDFTILVDGAFVRMYQGGGKPLQPVDAEAVLSDGRGEEIGLRSDRLLPGQFDARRAADYRVELPLARLSPGPYVLTVRIHAAGKASARGDVRFSVR